MAERHPNRFHRLTSPVIEIFGLSPGLALTTVGLAAVLIVAAIIWFIETAPPRTITITSGAPGSSFEANAGKIP